MNDAPNATCIYRPPHFQLDYDQAFETKPVDDLRVGKAIFSTLWDRTVLIDSNSDLCNSSTAKYFESDILERGSWNELEARNVSWQSWDTTNGELYLRPTTQSIWLQCTAYGHAIAWKNPKSENLHLSPVPLHHTCVCVFELKCSCDLCILQDR